MNKLLNNVLLHRPAAGEVFPGICIEKASEIDESGPMNESERQVTRNDEVCDVVTNVFPFEDLESGVVSLLAIQR